MTSAWLEWGSLNGFVKEKDSVLSHNYCGCRVPSVLAWLHLRTYFSIGEKEKKEERGRVAADLFRWDLREYRAVVDFFGLSVLVVDVD